MDDARASSLVLTKLLEKLGQDFCALGNAIAALAWIQREQPDLVFSDIGMPDFDGYQLAQAVRSDPNLNDIELVALTGYAEESDRQRARDAGFDQHLVKPVSLGNLQSLLTDRVRRLGRTLVRTSENRPPRDPSQITIVLPYKTRDLSRLEKVEIFAGLLCKLIYRRRPRAQRNTIFQHQRLAGLQDQRRESGIGRVQKAEAMPQEPAVVRKAGIAFEIVDASPCGLAVERAGDLGPGVLAQLFVLLGETFVGDDDRLGGAAVARREAEAEAAESFFALRAPTIVTGLSMASKLSVKSNCLCARPPPSCSTP